VYHSWAERVPHSHSSWAGRKQRGRRRAASSAAAASARPPRCARPAGATPRARARARRAALACSGHLAGLRAGSDTGLRWAGALTSRFLRLQGGPCWHSRCAKVRFLAQRNDAAAAAKASVPSLGMLAALRFACAVVYTRIRPQTSTSSCHGAASQMLLRAYAQQACHSTANPGRCRLLRQPALPPLNLGTHHLWLSRGPV